MYDPVLGPDEMLPAVNSSWPGQYLVPWPVGHLGAEVFADSNLDELMMTIAWIRCQIEVLRWRV